MRPRDRNLLREYVRNVLSPGWTLDADGMRRDYYEQDPELEDDQIVSHLRDAELENDDDDLGPVPPRAEPVSVTSDPYHRWWSPV